MSILTTIPEGFGTQYDAESRQRQREKMEGIQVAYDAMVALVPLARSAGGAVVIRKMAEALTYPAFVGKLDNLMTLYLRFYVGSGMIFLDTTPGGSTKEGLEHGLLQEQSLSLIPTPSEPTSHIVYKNVTYVSISPMGLFLIPRLLEAYGNPQTGEPGVGVDPRWTHSLEVLVDVAARALQGVVDLPRSDLLTGLVSANVYTLSYGAHLTFAVPAGTQELPVQESLPNYPSARMSIQNGRLYLTMPLDNSAEGKAIVATHKALWESFEAWESDQTRKSRDSTRDRMKRIRKK